MNQPQAAPVPLWFWAVAVFALLWNLMGGVAFLTEIFAQEAMMEGWTEEQKNWAESMPSWVYFEYAIAVGAGVAGSICLLMRKSWSVPLFAVCAVAVILQMVYSMLIAGGIQVMGISAAIMPCLVIALSIAFFWFSLLSKRRRWLA